MIRTFLSKATVPSAALGLVIAVGFAAISVAPAAAADTVKCPTDLPVIDSGKLTMSINPTEPPMMYTDANGNVLGQNVDFGDEIARRLCLQPEYKKVQFEVQIPGLQTKRWDMINTGLFYNEDRAKIMHLIPYQLGALSLVTAEGNPLNIKSVEDLAGKSVGVEIGGVEEQRLRSIDKDQVAKGMPAMDIHVYNTYGETFLALGAGQVSAVFADEIIGKYFEEKGKFALPVTGLFPGSPLAFAVMDPKLTDAVVKVLNDMLEDGTYEKIETKYGATGIQEWPKWQGHFAAFYNPK